LLLIPAQQFRCPYCRKPLPLSDSVTVDHVYPLSRQWWRATWGNLLAAHRVCNQRKSDRMPYPCEVLLLEAVNLRIGAELRRKPSKKQKRMRRLALAANAEQRPAALGLLDDCAAAIFESRQPLKFGETECSSN
jgi:CRISPR/Cas system Type II protein with McrA/HNH and RuvC-like nuclease domain